MRISCDSYDKALTSITSMKRSLTWEERACRPRRISSLTCSKPARSVDTDDVTVWTETALSRYEPATVMPVRISNLALQLQRWVYHPRTSPGQGQPAGEHELGNVEEWDTRSCLWRSLSPSSEFCQSVKLHQVSEG